MSGVKHSIGRRTCSYWNVRPLDYVITVNDFFNGKMNRSNAIMEQVKEDGRRKVRSQVEDLDH